jgi:hypothetical protein
LKIILDKHYRKTRQVIDNFPIKHPESNKKKCAIFVMVQDEKIFLPIWLKYYSRYIDGSDIYVFDHRTTDGSVEECARIFKFNIIKLDYPYSFDHPWFQFVARTMQAKLLKYYEYVIFTDIDEIILADINKYSGLDDYINILDMDYVRCFGYEVIHFKDKEKPFDSNKPVLEQRKYWYHNLYYDKTLISRKPLFWRIGFHTVTKIKSNMDNDLLLIHIHKLDFDMCWNKSFERSKLPWKKSEIFKRRGWQNRMTDFEEFKKYYFGWPKKKIITEIPQIIRETMSF